MTRSLSLNVDIDDDMALPRVMEILARSLSGLALEGYDAWIFAGTAAEWDDEGDEA